MIRVNLLLVREVKQRLDLQRQIQVACASLVVVLGICGWLFYTQLQTHEARIRERDQLEADIKALHKIVEEVEQFQRQTRLLQKKIDVIGDLKTAQRYPAPLLDEISRRLPEQVWLDALQDTGTSVKISGKSLNGNPGVADFMKNIERSPFFGAAGLVESKSETVLDRPVMSFTITVPILAKKKQATS
jgi:type IV pilus assembly protein PilN